MELQALYDALRVNLQNGQLTIAADQYERNFWSILQQTYQSEITLSLCTVNYYSTYIAIQGQGSIAILNQGKGVGIQILCYQRGDVIWSEMKLNVNQSSRFADLFIETSLSRIPGEGVYQYTSSILSDVMIKYPELVTNSDRVYTEYPFSISGGAAFPADTWGEYSLLTLGSTSVKGDLALRDEMSAYGNVKAALEVVLINHFTLDLLKSASLVLKLYTGRQDSNQVDFNQTLAGAEIELLMELEEITTPMKFTIPLFHSKEAWELLSAFDQGIALSEGINLLVKLLRIDNLSLPKDTPIDFLKLYQVNTKIALLNGGISGVDAMSVLLASSRPWILPIPWIRLQSFAVALDVTYGKGYTDPILTGEVAGTIDFNLGTTMLSLTASAAIPSLDMEASLVWGESDWDKAHAPILLNDLLTPFQVPSPNQNTGLTRLARLDVYASYESRAFSVRAEINDIFAFSIGDFEIKLNQILVEAELSSSTRNASIYGCMGFGQIGTASYFELYAMGAYLTGIWKFEGGLKTGVINIGKVLTQIFSVNESQILEEFLNIEVTDVKVAFDSDGNQYAIQAGFHAKWTIFGEALNLNSKMQLKRIKDQKDLYASAMFALSVGMFEVVVQANDFYSNLRNYLFRIQYDKLFLQAVYATENGKDLLTVSMGGETLGSLVEKLVKLMNPNAHFKLAAPWSVINQIDLSRFQLVINVTDATAGFYYRVGLKIPGLMKIEKIGIQYRPDEVTGVKKIFFALTGSLLEQEYTETKPLSWDALDGSPPDATALNQKVFTLYYLGVGQHLKNDEARAATSLTDALNALKTQIKPPTDDKLIPSTIQYDPDMNWLFGAEFKVDALKIGVVLLDPAMYGLMITVEPNTGALSVFAGLYLELLYRKITDTIGMFKATIMLPDKFRTVQLGIVSLKIGQVSFEIYTNGNFYIDAGFPHNADFSKSFVLEVYIFTGRGGIYLGALNGSTSRSVPKVTNGAFSTVLQLGVGLSFGLGRSFDFGIAKGGLSLEVFGIFEGVLGFFECKDDDKQYLYYKAQATVGIYGRLYLSIDFKVISVSASVEIKAYAQLTLESYQAMLLALDLSLDVEAKVKVLCFKVTFSYHFKKHVEFIFGESSTPPWRIAGADSISLRQRDMQAGSLYPMFSVQPLQADTKTSVVIQLLPLFSVENPIISIASQNSEAVTILTGGNQIVTDVITQTKPNYCVAFLPLLDIKNQKHLIGLMADWILSHWDSETISNYAELQPDMADQLTYELLYDFLQANAIFSFVVQQNNDDQEGAVIPMPPPVSLSWDVAGTPEEARTVIRYWRDSMVTSRYADQLTEYFEKLNADPTYQPMVSIAEDGEDISLAELIFLDYFQMAIREIIEQIKTYFSTISYELGDSAFTAAAWEQILLDNSNLSIAPGQLIFPQYSYQILQGDTLKSIAASFSISLRALLDGCGQQTMLLRQQAELHPASYHFNNQSGVPLKLIAALFFVRYEEFRLENGYQDYAAKIRVSNPVFPLEDEILELGQASILLPVRNDNATISWTPLLGDTLTRLGKMCAYYEMPTGTDPLWDEFRASVTQVNTDIVIPAGTSRVDGDITIAMLIRRLIPDQAYTSLTQEVLEGITSDPILTSHMTVGLINIPYTVVAGELGTGQTASDILDNSRATVKELALALEADRSLLDSNQVLVFTNQQTLKKEEVKRQLVENKTTEFTDALSRFLLQGLRIMNPWPEPQDRKSSLQEVADNIDTLPMFQAMKQQISFAPQNQDWDLWCQGEQEGCAWVAQDMVTRVFSQAEILQVLPDTQFSLIRQGPTQLPSFITGMPCYPVGSKQMWNISGDRNTYRINLLPANMCTELEAIALEPSGQNERGESIVTRWCSYMPLVIRKSDKDNIYPIYGANAQDRLLLQQAKDMMPKCIHLMYQPSQASGLEEMLIEDSWDTASSILMKTNLSLETNMRPVGDALGAVEEVAYEYSATLLPTEYTVFLRLLWECSVVGGGGYYLKLQNSDHTGLPDTIFDDSGNGMIYLLIEYAAYPDNRRGINSAITEQPWKDKLTYYEQYDANRIDYQTAFPPGCVGIRLETEKEPDVVAANSDITKQLFHIIGYKVEAGQSFDESNDSLPLVPQNSTTEGFWSYTPVIPLYRYVTGGSGKVYDAIGKDATVGFELRDILGNRAEVENFSCDIIPAYNDFVIAISEWPYQGICYEVLALETVPTLRITCAPDDVPQLSDALTDKLRAAYLQLSQQDMGIIVSSSLFPDADVTCDIKQFCDYLDSLLKYTTQSGEKPKALVVDIPIISNGATTPDLPKKVFLLTTEITIMRLKFESNVDKAKLAMASIGPKKDDTDAFVSNLEAALPQLRVAQGDGKDQSLYGITFGTDGAIQSILVKPYDVVVDDQTTLAVPEFYAMRPLCNQWISRSCQVKSLTEEGTLSTDWIEKVYSNIDMELWANRFLADIEKALLLSGSHMQEEGVRKLFDALAVVKGSLANGIKEQLIPLRAGATQAYHSVKEKLKDKLLRSLCDGYQIDLAAAYEMQVVSTIPCRLTVHATFEDDPQHPKTINKPEAILQPGKLETNQQDCYVMFVNASTDWQAGVNPDIAASLLELEYDIEDQEGGYQSSKWLSFVHPIDKKGVNNSVSVNIASQLDFPNLLKRCPLSPEVTSQACVIADKQSEPEDMLYWNYTLDCGYQAYEQDTLFVTLTFNCMENNLLMDSQPDLFDLFAQYDMIRDKLFDILEGGEGASFLSVYTVFTELADDISKAWSAWLTKSSNQLKARMTERTYKCQITMRREEGQSPTYQLVPLNGTEQVLRNLGAANPVVTTLSFDDPKLVIQFMVEDLLIYRCHEVTPFLQIVRNQDLLPWPINEKFIYRTAIISKDSLKASGVLYQEIPFGSGVLKELSDYQSMVNTLWNVLEISGTDLTMDIHVTYEYSLITEMKTPTVRIPVTLCLGITTDPKEINSIANNLYEWYNEIMAKQENASYVFDVTIYSENNSRLLLHFTQLSYLIQ